MTKFEEETPGSKFSDDAAGTLGDQAVAWAQRRFGTDFDRTESVRDLQVRLRDLGYEVFADGIFGKSTAEALEAHRAFEERRAPNATYSETYTANTSDGTAESFEGAAAQKTAERLDTENISQKVAEGEATFSTSRPADETQETTGEEEVSEPADTQPRRDEEELTARPVALSDSALESVEDDRLGFAPYVAAVVRFLLADQTRAPLALAINAPWGRGKTSFMNMIDGELHKTAQGAGVRVATTRFNPWKYSEAEQVWAAFVGNVARCIRDNLSPAQRFRFWLSRLWAKIRRNADLGLVVRVLVAVLFLSLLGLVFFLDWTLVGAALKEDYLLLHAVFEMLTKSDETGVAGGFRYLAFALFFILAVAALYIGFANKLGLNLLDYLEKTDFKDKIGTLSQFEDEMRRLSAAVPGNMKVVVFVDDLDRCKGPVLGEIVEALQLADVSESCIFVLGMDLNIVANVIETERQELAKSVDSGNGKLEHGSGYKFLEKIIQARLSLPDYGPVEMGQLIAKAMAPDRPVTATVATTSLEVRKDGATVLAGAKEAGVVETVMDTVGALNPFRAEEHIQDSSLVVQTATHFGSRHFQNPRRLKRFINGFRLQAYLAASSGPESAGNINRLARLLVLAEKWPALLEQAVSDEEALAACQAFLRGEDPQPGGLKGSLQTHVEVFELRSLSDPDRLRLAELLLGPDGGDPFGFKDLKELAEWYGFCYYPGLAKEG